MPKIYKPKEVIAKFKNKIFYNPGTGQRAVIPYNLKEIPKGTFASILRESKINKSDFEKA